MRRCAFVSVLSKPYLAQLRCFSITGPSSRKGNGNNNKDDKNEQIFRYDFDIEIKSILTKIHDEALKMQPSNEGFEIDFYPEEPFLLIVTQKGKLMFAKDSTRPVLIYQSFNSGNHNYHFDPEERVWLSDKDHHDIRGLVTRDLIKHNAGMPKLY